MKRILHNGRQLFFFFFFLLLLKNNPWLSGKRSSIAHSLSLTTSNRPDMTEIPLKRT